MLHNRPAKISPSFKLGGLFLQLSGWVIVISSLVLLRESSGARVGFVGAGIAVEMLGWALLVYSYGIVRRGGK